MTESSEQGCQHTTQQGVNVNPTGGPAESSVPCPRCNGAGTFTDCNRSRWRCSYCYGTGRVKA